MKSEVKMSGNRLQITRLFNAPPAMVFALLDAAREITAMVGVQGCDESRDPGGSPAGRLVHAEDADWWTRGTHVYGQVRGDH